jgi:hypothetical protein
MSFSQDLVSFGLIEKKNGVTNSVSTINGHLKKIGTNYDLSEFSCSIDVNSNKINLYIISQQSDLIYFEQFYDSTKKVVEIQGYYRLIYIDSETGYCWEKDLIWNYFDKSSLFITRKYYLKGVEIKLQ